MAIKRGISETHCIGLSKMTKNPGDQIVKSYLLIWRLTHHAVYNISITGVIVLSNEIIIDIIFMRVWHGIASLKLFLSAAKVVYLTFSCC